MLKRLDAMVTTESKDGNKTYWHKIGVAFLTKKGDGYRVILHANPLDGEFMLMPPYEKKSSEQSNSTAQSEYNAPLEDDLDDEVPF